MSARPVFLIYPPLVDRGFLRIYPSLPILAAALKQFGYHSKQLDLNNAFINWYLKSPALQTEIVRTKKRYDVIEKRNHISKRKYEQYEQLAHLNALFSKINNLHEYPYYICELTKILDLALPEIKINEELVNTSHKTNKTITLIKSFYDQFFVSHYNKAPSFIGITVATPVQIIPSLLLSRLIKKRLWKNARIFWGGAMMNYLSDDTYRLIIKHGALDGIVCGEGEEAIIEIASIQKGKDAHFKTVPNLIYLDNYELIRNTTRPNKHIREYPVPHYDHNMIRRYGSASNLSVILSRGCSWGRCAFCEYPKLYDRKQLIAPEIVVDNICHLIAEYPNHPVWLSCDMMEPSYMRELCSAILNKGAKFSWAAYMRADDRYSLADFKLLKRSGCVWLDIGIESLETKVLNKINKGYTADQALVFLKSLLKSGIGSQINIIVDLPGTTYKSARRQFNVLKEVLERAARRGGEYSVPAQLLAVSKNAPLGICPDKYGIKLAIPKGRHISDYIDYLPFVDKGGMSEDEKNHIIKLYNELNTSLKLMKLQAGLSNTRMRPSDTLAYQKGWELIQDHLFDPDAEDQIHHKVSRAFARLANFRNNLYFIIPNADLVRWILKKMPISLSGLKRVFKKDAPFRLEENDLINSINDMISIGMLKKSCEGSHNYMLG